MSNALFPMPVDQPISDEPKFSAFKFGMVFQRFLKAISDDLLQANVTVNTPVTSVSGDGLTQLQLNTAARNTKYTLNANLCLLTYDSTALTVDLTVQLPYTALLAFDLAGTVYPAGTRTVVIPAGVAFARTWYIVNPVKQGAT